MTFDTSSDLTVPELVDQFRTLAGQLGSGWSLDTNPERYRRTAKRAALLARMNALTSILQARAPSDRFAELLCDADRDVRGWAAARFSDFLPELAAAAIAGLVEDVSTIEAKAAIDRARTLPPIAPTLADSTLDELIVRFGDACEREFWSRHAGRGDDPVDLDLRNTIVAEIGRVASELARRGALDRLLPLLESDDITTRAEAARATMSISPIAARRTLKDVAASDDLDESGRAAMWLALRDLEAGAIDHSN